MKTQHTPIQSIQMFAIGSIAIKFIVRPFLAALLFVLLISPELPGQPVQVEIGLGNNKFNVNSLVSTSLDRDNKYRFTNISIIDRYHESENKIFDGNASHSYLYRGLTPSIGAGLALTYNDFVGFIPKAAFQYQVFSRQYFLNIAPALGYHDQFLPELLTTSGISHAVSDNRYIIVSIQSMNLFDDRFAHIRSIRIFQVAVSQHAITMGINAELSRFGPSKLAKWNTGVSVSYRI